MSKKVEIITTFLNNGYLLSPEIESEIEKMDVQELLQNINGTSSRVIGLEILESFNQKVDELLEEKQILTDEIKSIQENSELSIVKIYKEKNKKREIQDFVNYYNSRYNSLKKILLQRQELQNAISITRLSTKNGNEEVGVIAIIHEKTKTKNGNIILGLEDTTGRINAIVSNNKKDVYNLANDLCLDCVVGIKGFVRNRALFINSLILPDIPIGELKGIEEEAYAVFTSDVHVGSNLFYENDFLKFIEWLNTGDGSSKNISSKIKYLFIVGDLVEGVGIYPDQEKDLAIKDVYKQYEKCAELLNMIRKDIKIIACGGNHDAMRLSEPQPVLDKEIAKPLWAMSNIVMITNPGIVNICKTKDNEGINVLLYHGYSFLYFANNIESIRVAGGVHRPDLIMKYLLQVRHLAPSHTSTLFIPDPNEDSLVIDKIPDIFASGHLHLSTVQNYKNVTLIDSGCWVGRTLLQEKMGIEPDPGKIILVNLKTRETKILNFRENETN